MLIPLLAAALAFAQDAPKASDGPALPKSPTGTPIPMPDIGKADPDAVCFVSGTLAARDARKAGKDPTAADLETMFFVGMIVGRYDDAKLAVVMDIAKDWFTGKPLGPVHAACDDRYARAIERLRIAHAKSN